jgi:hypothetical protein
MSLLSIASKTLAEWAKGLDPDGRPATVINLLSQENPILQHLPFMEGNLPTGHRGTVLTGLPTAAWRLLNAGVVPSTGTKAQIDDQCGNLETWSQTDTKLAKLSGNVNAFRAQEAEEHLEAIAQEYAQTLFYGAASAPEEFVGLAARYSDPSAGNGANIINGGGSGSDNGSIWMLDLGGKGLNGIFPQGSQVGVEHVDHKNVVIQNAGGVTGALMAALVDQWIWNGGIHMPDWRRGVRVANVDIGNLTGESSAADLIKLLIKAWHRIRKKKNCHIYACPTIVEFLDIQGRDIVIEGGGVTTKNIDGEEKLSFRGVPIHSIDALLETETALTFA